MGSILYVSAHKEGKGNYLCAIDLDRNKIRWAVKYLPAWNAYPIVSADAIYLCEQRDIKALNAEDGSIKWTHRLRSGGIGRTSMQLADQTLYVGGEGKAGFNRRGTAYTTEGYLLALYVPNGDLKWMYVTEGYVYKPVVVDAQDVYLSHRFNKCQHICCLDANPDLKLGRKRWEIELPAVPESGTVHEGCLYWGCYDGQLCALSTKEQKLLWQFQSGKMAAEHSPPCVLNDWLFFTSSDGYLYGLDAMSGALRWKFLSWDQRMPPSSDQTENEETHASTYEDGQPVVWVAEERLFLLNRQGEFFCFNLPKLT